MALTIDDAPYLGLKSRPRRAGESRLGEILDVLAAHQARATFFLMSHEDGQHWYRHECKRVLAEGHEFGNHGTVDESHAALPPTVLRQRMVHCGRLLRQLHDQRNGGKAPWRKWYRPGGGLWNSTMLEANDAAVPVPPTTWGRCPP